MATVDDPRVTAERTQPEAAPHFIRALIREDLAQGRRQGVVTRFPPEPNGYLHIGHAKSICLNFGLAQEFGGRCHMRFDDTNPTKEDQEYVDSILEDIRWLGFDWGEHLYYASDYFERMYELAEGLIVAGKAYVDSLSKEELREHRGKLGVPGKPSPYRTRSIQENLDLFRRMRAGEFAEGEHVLRAKIDMGASNMVMRDPLLYRIIHASHHRTGDAWCIYPMYDYAHPLEDAFEQVTHSLCSLEFENNRELYDWVITHTGVQGDPVQTEFARLNLTYTVMSKRKLRRLVEEGLVAGWDDPRMPTIAGLRRRGVTPEAIRQFSEMIGVARANSTVDIEQLEFCVRDDLNTRAPRVLAVLHPLKVTLTNYPEGQTELLDSPLWPHDVPQQGSRPLPFGRTLYIERDDFMEQPPKKWHRLSPGGQVRLRHAYVITCHEVVRDAQGQVVELLCTYDPLTRSGGAAGGAAAGGPRVKGTIHWVSAEHALAAQVRLYDRFFTQPLPEADPDVDFITLINPDSLVVVDALVEPGLAADPAGSRYQFERHGYFISDVVDSTPERLVFNRIVGLRDTWAKELAKQADAASAERAAQGDDAPTGLATKEAASKEGGPKDRPHKRTRAELRQEARAQDPALRARMESFVQELGLSQEDADVLTAEAALAQFYEEARALSAHPEALTRWAINELMRVLKDTSAQELRFSPEAFAALVDMVEQEEVSNLAAKEILDELAASGGSPQAICQARGLRQISDPQTLLPIIDELIAAHPEHAQGYREGKTKLLGFFVGQTVQRTQGRANPKLTRELVLSRLDA